jgi:hypothetical protein
MLTIRAEIKKKEKRSDGTYNVKITFTLNRKVKRLATDLYVTTSDLTKSLDFKENTSIKPDFPASKDAPIFYLSVIQINVQTYISHLLSAPKRRIISL